MRAFSVALSVCTALLLPTHPATAEPPAGNSGASPFRNIFQAWRDRMLQPYAAVPPQERHGRVRAHPRAHSASTACLPFELKSALAGIEARFGPVTVISTHRPGARIRGGRPSHHASCQAVDFRPAPGTYARVAAHLRNSWGGGLGTYSSGHIHIDTGPNFRWHSGRRKRR